MMIVSKDDSLIEIGESKMGIRKKICYILFITFLVIGIGKVSLASNGTITYNAEYKDRTSYQVSIEGLEYDSEKYDMYRAMICQETDVTGEDFFPVFGRYFGITYNPETKIWEGNTLISYDVLKLYSPFEKKGQYYGYIAARKKQSINWTILDGPTKIETPPLPALGNRILFSNNTYVSTSCTINVNATDTMSCNKVQRTIDFYLGEVTDKTLLENLSKNGTKAYEELLQYAKEQEKNLKKDSFKDTKSGIIDYNVVANYPIKNGSYYFVHTILNDENGTYADVEDIGIYNGNSTSQGVKLDDFKYEPVQENKQNNIKNEAKEVDSTVSNKQIPKAGNSIIYILILVIAMTIVIVVYIKNKQYKDIK